MVRDQMILDLLVPLDISAQLAGYLKDKVSYETKALAARQIRCLN